MVRCGSNICTNFKLGFHWYNFPRMSYLESNLGKYHIYTSHFQEVVKLQQQDNKQWLPRKKESVDEGVITAGTLLFPLNPLYFPLPLKEICCDITFKRIYKFGTIESSRSFGMWNDLVFLMASDCGASQNYNDPK